jgi:N-acetylneuraminic acid mutarotase
MFISNQNKTMHLKKILFAILFFATYTSCKAPQTPNISEKSTLSKQKTMVSIKGNQFLINGELTYKGITWQGNKIEGLLFNSRMVQGIFDDLNPESSPQFAYPDTKKWDADRNTNEFIQSMALWRNHGLLAFTLNLQGGSPLGYGNKNWINSAFTPKGGLDPKYMNRLENILNKADELGMVVILGYFYFGQDQYLTDEKAVIQAVDNITNWVLGKGYKNIIVEINNETDISYDHEILKPERIHELINRVKNSKKSGYNLLVSTSYGGGTIPKPNVVKAADFILLHGNGQNQSDLISNMVDKTKKVEGYTEKPIVFNEDDHFDFEKDTNNFVAAVKMYASWGYFDYRLKGETDIKEGYQSVPVDWGINSDRKKGFFSKLKEITSGLATDFPFDSNRKWQFVEPSNTCTQRHECAAVGINGQLYLVGGRGIKPVEGFDPSSKKWQKFVETPIEMHHFQALAFQNEIYILGAFTGGYPHEKPIPNIWIFNPTKNEWRKGVDIPTDRQRGGAGAFVYKNKVYLVNGITDGHWDGHVAWFDVYDPSNSKWEKLPDSPRPRDHFQAAMVGDKLYIAGGRRSDAKNNQVFQLTIGEVDVFDFKTQNWTTLTADKNIPTQRAGCTAITIGERIIVIGGESGQEDAHSQCEAFNTKTQTWETLAPLKTGRHGTQGVLLNGRIFLAAGCAKRGGTPEQNSIEKFYVLS